MTHEISSLKARRVWDSRGRPTIEVEVTLAGGVTGCGVAPSGASTGSREALDRRDGGKRLGGYGVSGAIADLHAIVAPALAGVDAGDQRAVDAKLIELDGTLQKTRLGGNAIVATSLAVAQAAGAASAVPMWKHLRDIAGLPETPWLPLPMIQIFGGGRHAGGRIDVQDFLVLCPGAKTFAEAVEWTAEIYMAAADIMKAKDRLNGVADEGGIWPDFSTNEEGLEHLTEAIRCAGFRAPDDVGIALDIAASSFLVDGRYVLGLDGRTLDTGGLVAMLEGWVKAYPIVSLEDPLAEDDDEGFVAITQSLGDKVQIVGDDYLVTDATSIRRAAERGACNTALLKVNQCGTVTELIEASAAARAAGWNTIQSGRSGESEDVALTHLAVGLMSDQIKVGSMARSERTAKWNEAIRIEEALPAGALWRFAMRRRRGAAP